jgi:hypothetical protein
LIPCNLKKNSFVCAVTAANIGPNVHCFRTYNVSKNQDFDCKIWEAARATSAAPTFFKEILIEEEGTEVRYIDGAMSLNNPVEQVYEEAKLAFGEDRPISCIVSLGTGHQSVIAVGSKSGGIVPIGVIKALKQIATDCESASERFEKGHGKTDGFFFRFNVNQGLQGVSLDEWDKLGEVKAHTKQYLQGTAVSREVDKLIQKLCDSQPEESLV